jgi:hypothetical protein
MTAATAMSSVNAMPANARRVFGLIELVAEERPIVNTAPVRPTCQTPRPC